MSLSLYHVTTSKAARGIEQTQFRPGTRGYAGAAIYFSADPKNAMYHCFNGAQSKSKRAEVVICCSVDLGKCLPAEKQTVDKEACFKRGYDSVKITGTDTYAVYDSSRISLKEFRRISDDVCWYPSSVDDSATPLEIMINAIQTSTNGSLNASSNMGHLYSSKHASLRKAIRAAGGIAEFCEMHAELTMHGQSVTMAKTEPLTALDIFVAAIQASPDGFLNVTSDISQLCLKHSHLHEALRAAGGLKGFCEAHPELTKDGSSLVLSKQPGLSQQLQTRQTEEARQVHAKVRRQAEEERRQMQLQAAAEALQIAAMISPAASVSSMQAPLQPIGKATAKAQAKAKAEAKAKTKAIAKAFPEAKAEAREREAMAKADAEAKAEAKAKRQAMAQAEAEAKAEAKAKRKAMAKVVEEANAEVKARKKAMAKAQVEADAEVKATKKAMAKAEAEMRLKQGALQLQLQNEEAARQREAVLQEVEETPQQIEFQKELLEKRKARCTKSEKAARKQVQARFDQEQASQQRQLLLKQEVMAHQRLMRLRGMFSHTEANATDSR